MSRKDYQLIVEALALAHREMKVSIGSIEKTAACFCLLLRNDNPRFNERLFITSLKKYVRGLS
jgi:hypothetical protein